MAHELLLLANAKSPRERELKIVASIAKAYPAPWLRALARGQA
jgi:hypothetical protein